MFLIESTSFFHIYNDHNCLFLTVVPFFSVQKLSDDTFIPNKAKRRHARPHMLDSDDDDEDERKEDNTTKETSGRPDPVMMTDDPQKLVTVKFLTMLLNWNF